MRSERGQASVEWIVLVLLLTLALTALARFAPRADAGGLGAELLTTVACAARGDCGAKRTGGGPGEAAARSGAPAGSVPAAGAPSRLVTAPPLVPLAPRGRGVTRPRVRRPRFAPLVRRAGRGAGILWRRSWMLCLAYERVRYSVLHPEIRFTNATIPVSEGVRIANDCLSPADVIRDFGRPSKP
jgi:hypothetical protein